MKIIIPKLVMSFAATHGRNNELSETTTMNTNYYSGRRRQRSDIPSESKSSYYDESG